MDLECPYCEKELDICHDDGFGYQEGVNHEIQCPHCDKYFIFQTSISFYYEPYKADCLNDGKHDYQLTSTHPNCFAKMRCTICGGERDLTDDEKVKFNIMSLEKYYESIKTH